MGDELATELAELLSVDIDELPAMEKPAHVARLERARAQIEGRVLATLGKFDQSQAWRLDASYSVANWLQAHAGTSKWDAQRRMRLARHLEDMPATSAALLEGLITPEHARILAKCVANPRAKAAFFWAEKHLVNAARRMSADELAAEVAKFLAEADQDGPEPKAPKEDELYANRVGDRIKIDGDLSVVTGTPIIEAINERADQLFRRDRQVTEINPNDPLATRPPSQRRAEALGELVLAGSGSTLNPRRREPLYNVFVDQLTLLRGKIRQDSLCELDDGSIIPAATLEQWRCEAAMSRVLLDAKGVMLSYGREERYANRALRRALVARDRGCAVPGCDRPPQFCDAHHIVFWENFGETDIDNLVLVCRHHHRMIHHKQLSVEMVDGRPRFYDAIGALLEEGRWRSPQVEAA